MDEFNLIDVINKKTCEKFNFLRLKQVFFDESKNLCQVSLIYPNSVNLSEEDKGNVFRFVRK